LLSSPARSVERLHALVELLSTDRSEDVEAAQVVERAGVLTAATDTPPTVHDNGPSIGDGATYGCDWLRLFYGRSQTLVLCSKGAIGTRMIDRSGDLAGRSPSGMGHQAGREPSVLV
jgi:hypothetical protein